MVSTFCYNVSRRKENTVINPNKVLNLLYIDDLISILKKFLNNKKEKTKVISKFKHTKKISVKKLLELISNFENARNLFYIKKFSNNFEKNLYSTFVFFMPLKKIRYDLRSHKDKRGSFMEFLKTENNGQFSIFKAKNNQIRGYHFHHSKVEKFLVVNGRAKFFMKDITVKYYENSKNRMSSLETCVEIGKHIEAQVFNIKVYFKFLLTKPSILIFRILMIIKLFLKYLKCKLV